MKRLAATLRCDALLQFRAGFYYVGAFVAVAYVGLLQLLPQDERINLPLLIPVVLLFNVMTTTFYFVSALVLLEKSEGVLSALVVTPLRAGEYLASKVATLTFLALAENGFVLLLFYGLGFDPLRMLVGSVLLCALFTLAGFAAITRYESINEFLLPSIVIVTLLSLPVLEHLGLIPSPANLLFYLHPVQPALSLMSSAFESGGSGGSLAGVGATAEAIYGAVAGSLWLAVAVLVAKRAHRNFVVRTA